MLKKRATAEPRATRFLFQPRFTLVGCEVERPNHSYAFMQSEKSQGKTRLSRAAESLASVWGGSLKALL